MEQMPDTFQSLFIGYAVIWTMLILYILRLGIKINQLEKKQ